MNHHNMNDSQFLGYLTAKYTHEIRNIFSIMGESVGLMKDILDMDYKKALKYLDKLSSSINMIEKQLQRGDELSTHLNRLSHAPDRDLDRVDLDQSIATVVALSERVVRQNELNLIHISAERKVFIETNPLKLMMLIHGLIQFVIQYARHGEDVSIGADSSNGKITLFIHFRSDSNVSDLSSDITAESQEMLRNLCAPLQASFSFCSESPGIIVHLS